MFGDDIDYSVLFEVDCSGNEMNIFNCTWLSSGLHSEHSASVVCQGMHIGSYYMKLSLSAQI